MRWIRPRGERASSPGPVGGAVGEAEPALHACVEVVGVDPEIHVRLLPGGRGSVARRDRTVALSVRRSGRQRGRARWVRVVLGPDRSDADARDECPVGHRVDVRCPLRGEKPTVRWQLGRAVDIGDVGERASLSTSASTSTSCPSTSAQLLVPSHSTAPGRRSASRMSRGRPARPDPALDGRKRVGAQHDLGDEPERAERADDELGEVEAADVLHDRSTAGDDFAFGRHVPDLQNGVACRPRPSRSSRFSPQRLPRRRCRPGRAVPRSGRQRRAFHGVRRRSCRRGR